MTVASSASTERGSPPAGRRAASAVPRSSSLLTLDAVWLAATLTFAFLVGTLLQADQTDYWWTVKLGEGLLAGGPDPPIAQIHPQLQRHPVGTVLNSPVSSHEPTSDAGLSRKEAEARLRKLGAPPETSSRSTSSIIAGNVFTLFNAIIAVFFVSLFSVFGRPDIGLILAGVLLGPVIAFAWIDYAILARNARRYQEEERRSQATGPGPLP